MKKIFESCPSVLIFKVYKLCWYIFFQQKYTHCFILHRTFPRETSENTIPQSEQEIQIADKKFNKEKPSPCVLCACANAHGLGISWVCRKLLLGRNKYRNPRMNIFSNSSNATGQGQGFKNYTDICQDHRNLCLVQDSTASWKVPAQPQVPKSLHFPVQPLLFQRAAFSVLHAESHTSVLKNL